MLPRLLFTRSFLARVTRKSQGYKSLCQSNYHSNQTLIKNRNSYKVSTLRRLVKWEESNDNKIAVSLTFSSAWWRYMRLLPQLIKLNMSDKCETAELRPPPNVKGMTKLDRGLFTTSVVVPALRIPVKSVKMVSKLMKSQFLKLHKIKPVAELSDSDPDRKSFRMILLNPGKCSSMDDVPGDVKLLLKEDKKETKFEYFTLDLTYDNWSLTDVLKAVLPDSAENVSGFSIIGHIAHLNLKSEVEDYKFVIGQVVLDKTPGIRTVVNKLNIIDNTFRNFQMELLAGEDNYMTEAKENGCVFKFNFAKVYWNPRLGTEHMRIVDLIKKNDLVFDVFAGVGPFAIPAARRGAVVFANDLNPESFLAMKENIALNKIKTNPQLYNTDGRDFIKTVFKVQFLDYLKKLQNHEFGSIIPKIHIIMNLPALAVEFLDTFKLLCDDFPKDIQEDTAMVEHYPTIYCYGFSKSENPDEDLKGRAESVLAMKLSDGFQARWVRNVAPNKEMICLAISLTPEMIFGDVHNLDAEPEAKKRRLN